MLYRTSRNIQSKAIKAVNIKLHKLCQQRKLIKIKISETFSQEEQRRIRPNVRRRIQIIAKNIKPRHQQKIERNNLNKITTKTTNKSDYFQEKKREERKRVRINQKERIRKAKEEDPDQNAINLLSKVLTAPQKSVLAQGPSFMPTPNGFNWLNVREELDSFINQLRYFTNNAFQIGQEVELPEIAPNQEQERADRKIAEDPPKTKKNKISAMYKSKPTSNKNLELFTENLEKDLKNQKNVKRFRHNIAREERLH